MYDIPDRTDIRKCIITEETIRSGRLPLLLTKTEVDERRRRDELPGVARRTRRDRLSPVAGRGPADRAAFGADHARPVALRGARAAVRLRR